VKFLKLNFLLQSADIYIMIKLRRSLFSKWSDVLLNDISTEDFTGEILSIDPSRMIQIINYGNSNYSILYVRNTKVLSVCGHINEAVDEGLSHSLNGAEYRPYWRYIADSILLYLRFSIQIQYNYLVAFIYLSIMLNWPPHLRTLNGLLNLSWLLSALAVIGFVGFSIYRLKDFRANNAPMGLFRFEFIIAFFMLVWGLSSTNQILIEKAKSSKHYYKLNLPKRSIASKKDSIN